MSLALIFHELATNAGKYGAFSSPRGFLQVSWPVTDDRLNIAWDETEGPPVGSVGEAGFGTKLLKSALTSFDGKTEITLPEDRGSLHHAVSHTRELKCRLLVHRARGFRRIPKSR